MDKRARVLVQKILMPAWFQASAAVWMRFSLFWVVTQRWLLLSYGRFGTGYRCSLQGVKVNHQSSLFNIQERRRPHPSRFISFIFLLRICYRSIIQIKFCLLGYCAPYLNVGAAIALALATRPFSFLLCDLFFLLKGSEMLTPLPISRQRIAVQTIVNNTRCSQILTALRIAAVFNLAWPLAYFTRMYRPEIIE